MGTADAHGVRVEVDDPQEFGGPLRRDRGRAPWGFAGGERGPISANLLFFRSPYTSLMPLGAACQNAPQCGAPARLAWWIPDVPAAVADYTGSDANGGGMPGGGPPTTGPAPAGVRYPSRARRGANCSPPSSSAERGPWTG